MMIFYWQKFTRQACRKLLSASVVLVVWNATAKAELKLCNSTSSRVGVAIGFLDPKKKEWTSEGWWNVDSQSCSVLITDKLAARFYYVHALDYDRGGEWGGPINMCTAEGEFTILGIENCEKQNGKKSGFFEVDTQELNEWTINLTDQAPPAAQTGNTTAPAGASALAPPATQPAQPTAKR